MSVDQERWNHNIHYHRVILDAVSTGAKRALDVGCGEGILVRQLARTVPEVVGIDQDGPSIELAREHDGVEYVHGDFLDHEFEPGSFDLVASVATLHHMPAATALRRMRELLRPGGVLAVVGLARARLPADLPYELAGAVMHRVHRATKGYWEHSAPTAWPPPETYRAMRRIAAEELPGARFRRHAMWRYSLVWTA
ncbi:class I SAM-dependent methyltransferase [Pseudonocardia acaciae]|uniref:class I SAM-dependent methyltransferase n=1 Tax=Pseudonocardia acaciae TaxID=551276 RepID=UPI00048C8058|nr:class I SAM-dependent methyltransferase [Pseudonocardia acaciae]